MTPSISEYLNFYEKNKETIFDDFFTYLKFPSISTKKEHEPDIKACVKWLEKYLSEMEFETELWQTHKHPTLFAQNSKAGRNYPTLLIYLHYDVQPVDPLELWETPPFEPTIKDHKVFARGACDNKGQTFYTLWALKAILEKHKKYPLNLKLLIEGEEECGSCGLKGILNEKVSQLQSDYLLIVDVDIPAEDTPVINLGTRGICTAELTLKGSHTDLHSGVYGGVVKNPLTELCHLLSKFHDSKGRVTIPKFYDHVRKLNAADKEDVYLKLDEERFFLTHGIYPNGGESSYLPAERMGLRPTFEINGLWGGYIEEGFKTVIPSKAHAKVSMRLVPEQDPYHILEQFTTYIHSLVPKNFELILKTESEPAAALLCESDSKLAQAAIEAYTDVFQAPCLKNYCGGSLPIAVHLKETSGAKALCIGVALSTDQVHAPNEHLGLERFKKGFLVLTQLIEKLGKEEQNS